MCERCMFSRADNQMRNIAAIGAAPGSPSDPIAEVDMKIGLISEEGIGLLVDRSMQRSASTPFLA